VDSILEVIVERQPIGAEDMLMWLLRGDVKAESESEICNSSTRPGFTNKVLCNTNITNRPDCTTLYQHAQYWHNNGT
jgi:hypothetical protein